MLLCHTKLALFRPRFDLAAILGKHVAIIQLKPVSRLCSFSHFELKPTQTVQTPQ